MNNFVFYSPTEFVFGKATEMQVRCTGAEAWCAESDDRVRRRLCCTEWFAG